MMDLKSSYGTYNNHAAQVAAYGYAWNTPTDWRILEDIEKDGRITALWVVRLGKTPGALPYHISNIKGRCARLALDWFRTALEQCYINSGDWGAILEEE